MPRLVHPQLVLQNAMSSWSCNKHVPKPEPGWAAATGAGVAATAFEFGAGATVAGVVATAVGAAATVAAGAAAPAPMRVRQGLPVQGMPVQGMLLLLLGLPLVVVAAAEATDLPAVAITDWFTCGTWSRRVTCGEAGECDADRIRPARFLLVCCNSSSSELITLSTWTFLLVVFLFVGVTNWSFARTDVHVRTGFRR